MTAVPSPTAVTVPSEATRATDVSELTNLTFLLVAVSGATVAVICVVPPTTREAVEGETETPAAAVPVLLRCWQAFSGAGHAPCVSDSFQSLL